MTEEEYKAKMRDIKYKIVSNLTSVKNWLAFIALGGSLWLAYLQGDWIGVAIAVAGIGGASVQIVSKTKQNMAFSKESNKVDTCPVNNTASAVQNTTEKTEVK